MKDVLKNSLILGLITITLDLLFHTFYSYPMETFTYFFVKFALVFVIGLWVFKKKKISALIIGTLLFVLIFAGYYRIWEILYGYSFGYRVPDIVIRGTVISWEEMPYVVTAIWAVVHGIAFGLPSYFLQKRK